MIEHYDAQALATGQDGRPVYVKYTYGKGFVHLSTILIEKYLNSVPEAFFQEDTPDYVVWYWQFRGHIGCKRILDISSAILRGTEYILDQSSRCAVLANYGYKEVSAELILASGWRISYVLHGFLDDEAVLVPVAGAAILLLKRET